MLHESGLTTDIVITLADLNTIKWLSIRCMVNLNYTSKELLFNRASPAHAANFHGPK